MITMRIVFNELSRTSLSTTSATLPQAVRFTSTTKFHLLVPMKTRSEVWLILEAMFRLERGKLIPGFIKKTKMGTFLIGIQRRATFQPALPDYFQRRKSH